MKTKLATWWRQARPHTLTASLIPVFVGSALAHHQGYLNYSLLIAMLLASVFIQIATNNFNEYYDYQRGLDTKDSMGIGGAIVHDGISPRNVMIFALGLYFLALLLGLYIIMHSSLWIAAFGGISMAFGYLYSGGPYPIAATPFGEFFSGFFMGVGIIAISFYIHAKFLNLQIILISLPTACLIGAILMANNIRDLDGDRRNGRKTLAILLGRKKAILLLAIMFAFSYLWVIFLISLNYLDSWSYLVILSAPLAYRSIKMFQGKSLPAEMMPAMKLTGKTNTFFGLLLVLAIILSSR